MSREVIQNDRQCNGYSVIARNPVCLVLTFVLEEVGKFCLHRHHALLLHVFDRPVVLLSLLPYNF
jgi:hypothetical protein